MSVALENVTHLSCIWPLHSLWPPWEVEDHFKISDLAQWNGNFSLFSSGYPPSARLYPWLRTPDHLCLHFVLNRRFSTASTLSVLPVRSILRRASIRNLKEENPCPHHPLRLRWIIPPVPAIEADHRNSQQSGSIRWSDLADGMTHTQYQLNHYITARIRY